MSKFPVEPISDIVIVMPVLGERSIEMVDLRFDLRGRVLAVGPGRVTSEGVLIPPDVKVNDTVRLAPAKAIEAVFDSKRVWVTRESELLAVEVVA
jgi:chaperonin GroES